MRQNRDIETELYNLLISAQYSASAHSVPATLGAGFPHVHVTRTGGCENDMVIESNYIDFDVYAEDYADSAEEAAKLCGWIRELEGDYCYRSRITTLPYNNPDPRRPDIARTTIKAELLTRTIERS